MFDISLMEIILALVVAIVVLKPEDMPAAMRGVGRVLRTVKSYVQDISAVMEDGAREVKQGQQEIIGEIESSDGTSTPLYRTHKPDETL